jgi:hypothetical protein
VQKPSEEDLQFRMRFLHYTGNMDVGTTHHLCAQLVHNTPPCGIFSYIPIPSPISQKKQAFWQGEYGLKPLLFGKAVKLNYHRVFAKAFV